MPKKIKPGDKLPVSVKLEFEGTVKSHAILVENQFIPTKNNQRNDYEIVFDGDPVLINARFLGKAGSKIKNFEIKINNKVGFKTSFTMKNGLESVNIPVPYKLFDLEEVNIDYIVADERNS